MTDTTTKGRVEVPPGWEWATLSDVVEKLSNGLTKRQSKEPVGVPVSRIQTISKGTIDLNLVGYLANLSPQEVEKYKLRPGDILFSHINSDTHLGKTAIFDLDETLLLHGMNLLLIRVDTERVLPKLVHYLFNHLRFSGYFMSIAQHAVNQASINQAKMKAIPLPLPPLNEQRRIVEKIEELFTKLDAGVRSLEQARVQLKSYRRSVLKAGVQGELSREWRETHKDELEPASELLERILQERREKFAGKKYKEPASPDTSEHSTLPQRWEWASLEQLSWDSGYGTSSKCGYDFPGPPVLRIPNISRARVNLEDMKFADSEANLKQEGKVAAGDLLIIRTNGSRDLIGRAAIVKQSLETDYFFASYLIRYRLAGGEPLYRWVETIWHSQRIRSWMQATSATSAGQYNISVVR